jgi:Outer membrane efflux protein
MAWRASRACGSSRAPASIALSRRRCRTRSPVALVRSAHARTWNWRSTSASTSPRGEPRRHRGADAAHEVGGGRRARDGFRHRGGKSALLLGSYSAEIAGELQRRGTTPHVPDRLRAGVPVDLLRRRPDIRAAERQLAAATAWVGAAIADLFPTVAVTAGFGAQGGTRSGVALPIHNPIWSFGPGGYWPLLDFGKLDALINIQEMKAHEQFVNYKKTIVVAVEEVDQAIKQYRLDVAQQKVLAVALTASHRAVDLATERYERGVTDFLNVLDAPRQDYVLED